MVRIGLWPDHLSGAAGWKRHLILLGCGAISALALPPLHVLPGFWIGLAVTAAMALRARTVRQGFCDGWWFGVGHGLIAYYWIAHAFLVDPPAHAWLIPLGVGGIAAGLALFPATAFAAARCCPGGFHTRLLAVIIAFAGSDWVRGHLLTGFPWNLPITMFDFSVTALQSVSVAGSYGMGLWLYVSAFGPLWLLNRSDHARGHVGARMAGMVSLCIPAIMIGFGVWHLSRTDCGAGRDWVVRLVQPNVDQRLKWQPDLRRRHFLDLLRLSALEPAPQNARLAIIWPETATPFLFPEDRPALQRAADLLRPGDLIITGTPRRSAQGVHNSVMVLDHSGQIRGIYDKAHLVPFGEYIPFRDVLPFGKLTAGRTDFTPGPGPGTLSIEGLPPVSPLICYEVIFPGAVLARDGLPAEWMLNVTNDGWFGLSSGPYQHLAASRLRAIEHGMALVRVANTGISAYFDSYGRLKTSVSLNTQGVVDIPLSQECNYTTLYNRFGEWIFVISLLVLLSGLMCICVRRSLSAGSGQSDTEH